jgi:membrane protein DedA with SNARE-associated domain
VSDPTPAGAEDDGETEARPVYSRASLYLLLAPIVVLTVLAYIGDALAPTLVNHHPVWLILLNTRKRYLALTSTHIDPVTFVVVGVFRQMLSDPLYFLIGRRYGDAGVRWLERKLGDGAAGITLFEKWFKKAAYPMVAIAPNPIISVLAGASKMKASVFLALNLGGTVVTIIILRLFGDVFSSPLDAVLRFLHRYQWPLTIVSVLLVAYQIVVARRSGRSDLESVAAIEHELEEAKAELAERHEAAGEGSPGDGDGD